MPTTGNLFYGRPKSTGKSCIKLNAIPSVNYIAMGIDGDGASVCHQQIRQHSFWPQLIQLGAGLVLPALVFPNREL